MGPSLGTGPTADGVEAEGFEARGGGGGPGLSAAVFGGGADTVRVCFGGGLKIALVVDGIDALGEEDIAFGVDKPPFTINFLGVEEASGGAFDGSPAPVLGVFLGQKGGAGS